MTAVVYWRDKLDAALKEAGERQLPVVLEIHLEG